MNLHDRVAVVTGGTRGIGFAISRRLHDAGAVVAVTGRREAEASKRAEEIGERAFGVSLEVTDPASVRAAMDGVVRRHGRIDVLVNNAGISGPIVPTVEYRRDEWRRVMATNLDGAFYCVQEALPHMLARNWGRIVNVSSIAGKEGNPNMSAYSASKAGLIGFTKSLGKELATTGVLVNCITPGVFETDILEGVPESTLNALVGKIPMSRVGMPFEAAALVVWLCSDECSFSTGAVFDLSGGRATY
jgi:NAD(P)-dependent dehydrogenase (short-subunit alcohol dehydrogenase family)